MSFMGQMDRREELSASTLTYGLVIALLIALQFGPAIGLAGFLATGRIEWTLIGASRDVLVLALLLQLGVSQLIQPDRQNLMPSCRWALAMIVSYAILSLMSSSSLTVMALNLRRLVLIPILFVVVLHTPWSKVQIKWLFSFILSTSLLVAALGIAERLAPDRFWTDFLRVDEFTAANAADRFGAIGFYEGGRFFNWDVERWLGAPLRRMVSTYIEPTTLSAGLAAALCAALAKGARMQGAQGLVLLFLVAGILTVSKAFAIFLIVLITWRTIGWPQPTSVVSLTLVTSCLGFVVVHLGYSESTFEHVSGLVESLRSLVNGNLLGSGIGSAGNYSDQDNEIGGESGLGNAIAQAGLLGVLPLIWVRALSRDLAQAASRRGDPGGPWLAMWLMFWLVSFLFSASSLGVGGNALGFTLLALYLHPASDGRPR
jgi:hypothetical protein